MSILSRSDFLDWKSNKVTEAFFEAAQFRIAEAKEILANSAGSDPLNDRYLVGLIAAYSELQDFRVEDLVDGD